MEASDLVTAINKIKAQNYIAAPIVELSADRKTITTVYLAEADNGLTAKVGDLTVTIKAVHHIESEPDEDGNTTLEKTEITVSRAVAAGAEVFNLENVPSTLSKYDVTEEELNAILEEIAA